MRLALVLSSSLVLGVTGCKQKPEPAPAPVVSTTPSALVVPTPSASVVTAPPPAPPPSERCKALEKGKLVAIGSRGGRASGITARAGKVYVFAFEGAKATLVAMPRDGAKAQSVGSVILNNPPTDLVVDERAAYFVAGKKLQSLLLTGDGKSMELARDLAPALAVRGEAVYAVRCGKPDALVTIPRAGGEAKVIAEIPQKPGTKCEYKSMAVDDKTVVVGDWSSRRIFAVDLASGTLSTLVEKQAFLGSIALESDRVEFQASTGILSVPRTGGTAKSITTYGATPFESVVWDERDFYVLHTEAYAVRDTLVRIPRAGGKLEELEFWKVSDVTSGGGRAGVAIDEQCVYVAQNGNDFLEVLARKKP
jgi:hypothetical protein